ARGRAARDRRGEPRVPARRRTAAPALRRGARRTVRGRERPRPAGRAARARALRRRRPRARGARGVARAPRVRGAPPRHRRRERGAPSRARADGGGAPDRHARPPSRPPRRAPLAPRREGGRESEGIVTIARARRMLTEAHPYPGRLITVEGIDGSGKSTQLLLLERWLSARGYPVRFTEWNSSRLVRRAMKRGKKKDLLTPTTFSLLHAVDFADRLTYQIVPPLKAGMIVLADRYVYTAFSRDVARGVHP